MSQLSGDDTQALLSPVDRAKGARSSTRIAGYAGVGKRVKGSQHPKGYEEKAAAASAKKVVKKRKSTDTAEASTSDRNVTNFLRASGATTVTQGKPAKGGRNRCWSHCHFLAKDATTGEWNIPVSNDNFNELKRGKSKVVCSFCLKALVAKY